MSDRLIDWLASWLFIVVSIACGIATFAYAVMGEFVEVAAYFYCSLMWFDMHLKNLECIAMIKRMEAQL